MPKSVNEAKGRIHHEGDGRTQLLLLASGLGEVIEGNQVEAPAYPCGLLLLQAVDDGIMLLGLHLMDELFGGSFVLQRPLYCLEVGGRLLEN